MDELEWKHDEGERKKEEGKKRIEETAYLTNVIYSISRRAVQVKESGRIRGQKQKKKKKKSGPKMCAKHLLAICCHTRTFVFFFASLRQAITNGRKKARVELCLCFEQAEEENAICGSPADLNVVRFRFQTEFELRSKREKNDRWIE